LYVCDFTGDIFTLNYYIFMAASDHDHYLFKPKISFDYFTEPNTFERRSFQNFLKGKQ